MVLLSQQVTNEKSRPKNNIRWTNTTAGKAGDSNYAVTNSDRNMAKLTVTVTTQKPVLGSRHIWSAMNFTVPMFGYHMKVQLPIAYLYIKNAANWVLIFHSWLSCIFTSRIHFTWLHGGCCPRDLLSLSSVFTFVFCWLESRGWIFSGGLMGTYPRSSQNAPKWQHHEQLGWGRWAHYLLVVEVFNKVYSEEQILNSVNECR